MRPDVIAFPPVGARVAALNAGYGGQSAASILRHALDDPQTGRVAMVSSFGADAVALLHMVSRIDASVPVIFVDTELLFPETLAYQQEVADALGLRDVRVIRASRTRIATEDPDGTLRRRDPDACCALRKSAPLIHALAPFDAWITGRKRFQNGARAALEVFEAEGPDRIKINPLAHWTAAHLRAYLDAHALPRHPLVARGYPSIGCAPCTTPVAAGEDPRAGRWRDRAKQECGIHFEGGRMVRRAS